MNSIGADIREESRSRPHFGFSNRQSFVLVMVMLFFGTIHQSTLGQKPVTSSHTAALFITLLSALGFLGLNLFLLRSAGHLALPELLPSLLPKPLAAALLLFFALTQLLYSGLSVRYQSEGIAAFMLEKTPFDVLVAALLITAILLLQSGLRQLTRVSTLLFWVILLPLIAVFFMAAMQMDWGELASLKDIRTPDLASELQKTIPMVFNLQLVLFLEGHPAKAGRKGLFWATGVAMTIQCIFFAILVGIFTLNGLSQLHLPIAELIRVTNAAPYSLFERLDVFFLAARTMLVVLNLALWLYAACRCLQGAFALSDIRILLPIAAVLAFSVSMLGRDVEVLARLQSFAGLLQWIACAGLIPILAIVAAIRCKGGKMP